MTPKTKVADLPEFDMAEYLQTDEDVANYLTTVLEENDPAELTHALGVIARACTAHEPAVLAWLGRLIPGPFGTIDQELIGQAFVGEFLRGSSGTVILDNAAMRALSREWAHPLSP